MTVYLLGFILSEFKTVDSNYLIFVIFLFLFSFLYFRLIVRVNVMILSYCHMNAVTVTVTQSHVTWKSIKGSGRMMSYSMFNTC